MGTPSKCPYVWGNASDSPAPDLAEDPQHGCRARKKLKLDPPAEAPAPVGVSFDKAKGLWKAQIHKQGKNIHLGRFTKKADARSAHDCARIKLHSQRKDHSGLARTARELWIEVWRQ